MADKEWQDIKGFNSKTKVEVDLSSYLFSDTNITNQRVTQFIDLVVQLDVKSDTESQMISLTAADLMMLMLSMKLTPEQYEFFYNKHILEQKFDK